MDHGMKQGDHSWRMFRNREWMQLVGTGKTVHASSTVDDRVCFVGWKLEDVSENRLTAAGIPRNGCGFRQTRQKIV